MYIFGPGNWSLTLTHYVFPLGGRRIVFVLIIIFGPGNGSLTLTHLVVVVVVVVVVLVLVVLGLTLFEKSLKPLSHLDVLASLCRRMKNLANMLAHIEYVMGKFCIF